MNLDTLAQYALSALVAIGIIVLIAMGKVSSEAGLPVLAALGGIHVGGQIASSTEKRTINALYAPPPRQEPPA